MKIPISGPQPFDPPALKMLQKSHKVSYKIMKCLFILLLSSLCISCLSIKRALSSTDKLERPTRKSSKLYEGPIFDCHLHIATPDPKSENKIPMASLIDFLRKQNVEGAIVFPTPNDGRKLNHEEGVKLRKELKQLGGKRIVRFCGSNYLNIWFMVESKKPKYDKDTWLKLVARVKSELSSGQCIGIGEIAFSHFEKFPGQHELVFSPDFEPFQNLVKIVAEYDSWLLLHVEPKTPQGISHERAVFGAVENLFLKNRGLKLILAHTAVSSQPLAAAAWMD